MGKQGTEYKVRTITCQACGVELTKRMPAGRRFCSLTCYRAAPKPDRLTGVSRPCGQCGTTFYVPKSRADTARFCSIACHDEMQGRHKTSHVCKVCGKTFRWSPSRSTSGNYRITYCSLVCRDADPDRVAMLLAMNERQQSGRMTSAERDGYALLDRLGVEYGRQVAFAGKFIPDAVVPSARLVVQFDGDYWHDRKGTSTETRIRRRVERDRSQDAYVRACGWDVVRLWASDLRDNPEGCMALISQGLHRPLGVPPARDPLARV